MSASVANDQVRSIIQRILRLKEAADEIAVDVREVYAEAKSNGFDKTALGQAVSFIRKREKDGAAFAERNALLEMYVAAYDGTEDAPRAHPHARASNTKTPPARVEVSAVTKPIQSDDGERKASNEEAHNPASSHIESTDVGGSVMPPASITNLDQPPEVETPSGLADSGSRSADDPRAGTRPSDAAVAEAGRMGGSRTIPDDDLEIPAILRRAA
jgi:uncharacterized protein (UPF0335 family)